MRAPWSLLLLQLIFLVQLIRGTVVQDTKNAFTCSGKIIGGYYADIQKNCQSFHVCTIGEKGKITDIIFKCVDGTVFDQETRVCEREEEVDCSQSVSFYHLNNELYGPETIPDTSGGPIIDGPTTVTRNDIQTPDLCRGLEHHALVSAPDSDCKEFHMCITNGDQKMVMRKFRCIQDGFIFDYTTGKCSPTISKCIKSRISLKNKQIVDPLQVCHLMPKGAFFLDQLSNCEQYFQCPQAPNTVIATRRCQNGYLFSQKEGTCVQSNQLNCRASTNELLRYLSRLNQIMANSHQDTLDHIKLESQKSKLLIRTKRNGLMHINPKDISRGDLTKLASIVDGPLVPRNNVQGIKKLFPVFEQARKKVVNVPKKVTFKSDIFRKETAALNNNGAVKTNTDEPNIKKHTIYKNGTTFEETETTASNNKGTVRISSVVPKVVHTGNGNGNNLKQKKTEPEMEATASNVKETNKILEEVTVKEESTTAAMEPIITTEIFEEVTELTIENEETTIQPEETTIIIDTTSSTVTTTATTSTATTPSSTTPQQQITESTKTTEQRQTTVAPTTNSPTNFTCKDKELEQFYPDTENNCTVFHYCSPGFTDNEVLDLTFVCSGDTGFDIITKKCENISTVNCGTTTPQPVDESTTSTTTTTTTTSSPSTTTTTTSSPSTTIAFEGQSTSSFTTSLPATATTKLDLSESSQTPTENGGSSENNDFDQINEGDFKTTEEAQPFELSTTADNEPTQTSEIEQTASEIPVTNESSSIVNNESPTTIVVELSTESTTTEELSHTDKIS